MTQTHSNGQPQRGQLLTTHAEPQAVTDSPHPTRTRPPRDTLGHSARSDLFLASLVAGFGFAVLFVGLTFGPYYWNKSQGTTKATPAPAEKSDAPPASLPVAPAPTSPDPGAAKLPPGGSPVVGKVPGKGDILDKLGESGTKAAPAKVNPLDKKDDDILKDIK